MENNATVYQIIPGEFPGLVVEVNKIIWVMCAKVNEIIIYFPGLTIGGKKNNKLVTTYTKSLKIVK